MLVRRVPLVDHIDEVAKEEIAHIVEATVDALLLGGRIGVATDEPRPPKPPRSRFGSPACISIWALATRRCPGPLPAPSCTGPRSS